MKIQFFHNFALTWDFGLVLFLFLAMFFVGLSMGRRRLVLLLHSIYLSLVLIRLLLSIANLTREMSELQRIEIEIGLFLGIIFFLFVVLAGSHLSSALQIPKAEESPFWHLTLLAIATAGFLFSSILAIFPPVYYNKLSSLIQNLYLFHGAQFWWAVGGILVLVLMRRKADKNSQ